MPRRRGPDRPWSHRAVREDRPQPLRPSERHLRVRRLQRLGATRTRAAASTSLPPPRTTTPRSTSLTKPSLTRCSTPRSHRPAATRRQRSPGPRTLERSATSSILSGRRSESGSAARPRRMYLYRATPDAVLEDDLARVDRALYLTAAMTGLRQGELLGLRWRDVDWAAQKVRVVRPYVRGKFRTPKSRILHEPSRWPIGSVRSWSSSSRRRLPGRERPGIRPTSSHQRTVAPGNPGRLRMK